MAPAEAAVLPEKQAAGIQGSPHRETHRTSTFVSKQRVAPVLRSAEVLAEPFPPEVDQPKSA